MKERIRYFFLIVLVAIWTSLVCAVAKAEDPATGSYAEAIQEFEKFVKDQMALDKAPGLSVGFLKDDFTWARGFGYSDLENMVPASPESSYRLASVTKTITAIAVMQLVVEGKIDLDAEVQTYVPYFPKKKWPVTVRLLLGHLGGISHYKDNEVEGRIKAHKNTKEALAIFQDFDLVAEPGTKYNYSSYGYNLLGAVIEGASNESYGTYIRQHIFKPLGMSNSLMDNPVELIPNRVRGYRLIRGAIKNSEYVDVSSRFAAGGTRSTVIDLLKYARGIMEGKLLKKETWHRMFTSMASRDGRFTGYGLGWSVRPWNGHFQVSHGGSQPETRTHLLIFPAEKFAIAIASNMERINLMSYVRRLAELVLEEDLDSSAYVSDRAEQVLSDSCSSVFSYGLSQFIWKGNSLTKDEKELAEAFSFFNTYLNKDSLRKNFKETKKTIETGFHPVSDQKLIKAGAFMASALRESFGEERLRSYHKKGPIAFFSDYAKISENWPPERKSFKFNPDFADLISAWEKEWNATYTDEIRHLNITVNSDFDELGPKLKKTFAGAKLYHDFTQEMEQAGHYFLRNQETQKALNIFTMNYELYPNSPAAVSGLASAKLWTGNSEEARTLFKKAFALDPDHPSLSQERLFYLASQLEQAMKIKEIFILADIALELYPQNAQLHKEVGDIYLKTGQKEKALNLYRKALQIDPNFEDARKALEKLEKKK